MYEPEDIHKTPGVKNKFPTAYSCDLLDGRVGELWVHKPLAMDAQVLLLLDRTFFPCWWMNTGLPAV